MKMLISEVFREVLEVLKEGDVVIFQFLPRIHWATNFLAFFGPAPHFLEYVDEWRFLPWQQVNILMAKSGTSTTPWKIKCRVLRPIAESQTRIEFVLEYIYPLLAEFEVTRFEKE